MRRKDEALHQRRRTQVLAAAAKLFAQKGLHQTTMQEICEFSGVSAGALYRYFPSKGAIITAFAEEERNDTRELIDFLNQTADVVSRLDAIVPDLVEALTDDQYARLTPEIGAEAARNATVAGAFERNEHELRDALEEALRRGQAEGFVEPSLDVEATVFLLIGLFDGLAGRSAFVAYDEFRLKTALRQLLRRSLSPLTTAFKE